MNCSAVLRTGLVLALLAIAGGCSDDEDAKVESTGGAQSTGGSKAGVGGAGARGGTTSVGGTVTAGGSTTTGGASAAGSPGVTGGVIASAGNATAGRPSASGGVVTTAGTTSTAGSTSATGGAPSTAGASAVAGATSVGGAAGAGATVGVAGNVSFAYFIKQPGGTTTASLASGVITVNSAYSSSGNAFKWVSPNYYGTNSNGFISLPTPMTGDFSIAAEVSITTQVKANNACGIGLGIATGFNATDAYSYMLMRNSVNSTNGYYVNSASSIQAGGPTVAFTTGTPLQLTFRRAGTTVTMGAGPVGGTQTTQTVDTSLMTNGTTVYGAGAVYPAISFNNVVATISNLVIKDAAGATVYDSATGALVTFVPAALTLSASTASMKKGATASVTATANANGGAVSAVTAVAADPTIVGVTVTAGAADSTIALSGLKGGVTTVTITNTNDTNTATNTKTLTVSVNDYATTDPYGSLATVAYPVPAATTAYTDGELSLTFDAAPTLNTGGSIKIFKASDGTEVDSIAFAGEKQTFGTTAINVGAQLVRLVGNTVYFAPHIGKLAYGTAYYVGIPTTAITGTLNGMAFNGLSDLSTVATWKFTTRAAPTLDAASITVDGAQASTANFRTVQGALNGAAGLTTAASVTINVAAGTYNELLRYVGTLGTGQTVRIVGPAGNAKGDTCVVQWVNGNTMNASTQTRASFYFTGANLVLENITLKNKGVRSEVAQAETLYFANTVAGTTLAAFNSSFFSNQDTIQTSGRNWFYKCHIEGNTDFIWGTADAALFEGCDLKVVNESTAAATYSMFVARTGATIAATANGTVGKGYVLLNSTVTVDTNVTAYFGRDAGTGAYYDQVALVNVVFDGAGTIGTGLWNVSPTAPLSLGNASYVGWKSAGCSGLNYTAALPTAAGTSTTIADQATEYDTRSNILNRVVTVTAGAPVGYQAAAAVWDVSSLATAWSAP